MILKKGMIIRKLLGGGAAAPAPPVVRPWIKFKSDKTGQLDFNS